MAKKVKSVRNSRRSKKSSSWQLSAIAPNQSVNGLKTVIFAIVILVIISSVGWWWVENWPNRSTSQRSVTRDRSVKGNVESFVGRYEGRLSSGEKAELEIKENGELSLVIKRIEGEGDEERIMSSGRHTGYWQRTGDQKIMMELPTLGKWDKSEWVLSNGQLKKTDDEMMSLIRLRERES